MNAPICVRASPSRVVCDRREHDDARSAGDVSSDRGAGGGAGQLQGGWIDDDDPQVLEACKGAVRGQEDRRAVGERSRQVNRIRCLEGVARTERSGLVEDGETMTLASR